MAMEPVPSENPTPEPSATLENKENSEKPKSQKESIQKLIKEKIDSGFLGENPDKNSISELKKQIMSELKIPKNSRTQVKDLVHAELVSRKIKIPELNLGNKIEGLTVNLTDNPKDKPITTSNGNTKVLQSPVGALPKPTDSLNPVRGALPKTQTEIQEQSEIAEPEKKYMSSNAQEKLIKKALNDLVAPLYITLGIVEPDEEEKEDEAKLPTAKQFRKDMDDFGTDINEFLTDNEIKLPAMLNFLALGLSFFMVMVAPVLKFKFFSSKQDPKPQFDKSAENVEIKV